MRDQEGDPVEEEELDVDHSDDVSEEPVPDHDGLDQDGPEASKNLPK